MYIETDIDYEQQLNLSFTRLLFYTINVTPSHLHTLLATKTNLNLCIHMQKMKAVNNGVDLLKSNACHKTSLIIFISLTFFYLGKHWSPNNGDQSLIFFTTQSLLSPSKVILSPNLNKLFDLSTIINDTSNSQTLAPISPLLDAFPPSTVVEMAEVERMGVLDETGAMKDEFSVGEFDLELVEDWSRSGNESEVRVFGGRVRVKRLKLCDRSMSEYIPCLDNVEVIRRLRWTKNGEKFERHCPEKSLNCIVPTPLGYTTPIPWPTSRDEVLGPHSCLLNVDRLLPDQ